MEDETLSISRLTYEHPEILEIHTIWLIDDEISSLQSSLILLSLVGVEMMWDGSTSESDTWLLPFWEGIDVFEFDTRHLR
jgi:hypothetical protein